MISSDHDHEGDLTQRAEHLQALRDEFYAALVIMRNYYAQAISRSAVDEILERGQKFIKQTDELLARPDPLLVRVRELEAEKDGAVRALVDATSHDYHDALRLAHAYSSIVERRIETPCPSCGSRNLYRDGSGHLRCPFSDCQQPHVEDAIDALRERAEAAEAKAAGNIELARRLRFDISAVLSNLERGRPDAEDRAMMARLREWDAMALKLGWPEPLPHRLEAK